MGIEKKVYSFRFVEAMVVRLKHYAKKQNRNFSNFVETILKAELERLEEDENELQQAALADSHTAG